MDGPRSPPNPPSPRAKIDRVVRPQRRAVERGHRRLGEDHRGLALVPDVDDATGASRAPRWRQRPGDGHRLAAVQDLGELDVDAGERHGWRLGQMEALRHVAERRQHLRRVVHQIAQLAWVHRIGARAEREVIQLHIATGPTEFAGRQLGADRHGRIDRHVRPFPQYATPRDIRTTSPDRSSRPGPGRYDPSPAR